MLKRALYDYIRSFRWKNFVETYKNSMLFVWILFLNLFNMLNNILDKTKSGAVCYLLWFVVLLIGLIGMALCPLKLPKIMFLSPMNTSERRKYIGAVYWVRILVPTFIEVLVGTILVVLGILESYIVLISVFCLGSIFIFCALELTVFDGLEVKQKDVKMNVVAVVGMIIVVVVQFCVILFEEELHQGINVFHYALVVAIAVIVIMNMVYLRKLPKRIEKIATYEERFDIIRTNNQLGKAR